MNKELQIAEIIHKMRSSHEGTETFAKIAEKITNSDEFRRGTDKDIERILIQLCYVVYNSTKGKAVKVYGANRFSTTEMIKATLYSLEPPKIDFNIK